MASKRARPREFKAIKPQSAHGAFASIIIYDIERGKDDYVVWRWSFGEGTPLDADCKIRRSKIHYNKDGSAYFMNDGRRERLDRFYPRVY